MVVMMALLLLVLSLKGHRPREEQGTPRTGLLVAAIVVAQEQQQQQQQEEEEEEKVEENAD